MQIWLNQYIDIGISPTPTLPQMLEQVAGRCRISTFSDIQDSSEQHSEKPFLS